MTGVAHLSLTVRNLRTSEAWWRALFGWETVFSERDPHFDSVILQDPASGMVLSLRQRHAGSTARFDETRIGLDHVSFGVAAKEELDQWAARLTELKVEHTPVTETPYGSVLVFRDPDHIQIEFFCPGPLVAKRRAAATRPRSRTRAGTGTGSRAAKDAAATKAGSGRPGEPATEPARGATAGETAGDGGARTRSGAATSSPSAATGRDGAASGNGTGTAANGASASLSGAPGLPTHAAVGPASSSPGGSAAAPQAAGVATPGAAVDRNEPAPAGVAGPLGRPRPDPVTGVAGVSMRSSSILAVKPAGAPGPDRTRPGRS